MPIEIKNLTYLYSPNTSFERIALSNINLTIQDGEFTGLIGQTGSGKSTLIQNLNGLIKPTQGNIFIENIDIHKDKKTLLDIRKKVGIVFQYPEYQLFETTIFKDVSFGPKNMGMKEDEIDRNVKEALNIVGIPEALYEKSPFEISGGQKRRVAIAGVLAMKPKILVLDEPTAGLDPKGRDDILNNIKILHKKLNITIILVSHSMEDIATLVDKIIVLNKGEIFAIGTPSEIFSRPNELSKIGLAPPQITMLMHRLREKGFNVPTNIFTLEDATNILKDLF